MTDFALTAKPSLKVIDLSRLSGPTDAHVVVVPLPKNTFGVVFGQRTAGWLQGFNSYVLDSDHLPVDVSALWVAPSSEQSRAMITKIVPEHLAKDPSVLSVGPFMDDRYIAVLATHQKPGDDKLVPSDPKFQYHSFKIGSETKPTVVFTMVNAEDGGDADYHDTVVGVAVVSSVNFFMMMRYTLPKIPRTTK
ncbi:hypothetical protein R3P38DRAFT_3326369 [Favolaschia claudopus]|uniref:Uncharacterized protein n=1 Tax=Favolaschia claudopus TaxID=2862362 RepID=A0AAW0AAP6_9AGAR